MANDPPERPDRLRDGLALVGQIAVGLLGIIAVVVLATRLGWFVLVLIIAPIGVVILLVTSVLWGGVLFVVGRVLSLPLGPNDGLPAAEGVGQVLILLLGFGPPLVVTFIATRWVIRRLLRFLDGVTSNLEG